MKRALILAGLFLLTSPLLTQAPANLNSVQIHESIKKLAVLGSVLYVGAHPDDENTQIISYMANKERVYATYLSLTRGGGGQNLIGPEIQDMLGIIRTQELLAARSVDGGRQFFSRAKDFGYSKHPDETLRIWNKEDVLADVVWAIRKLQPDVIINRFDHRTPGQTHGHHTSSAVLSHEAFDLSGRRDIYSNQLELVEPWSATRLFYNTSWWAFRNREAFEQADKSNMISLDVGVYYPIFGESNGEIAARSRSMHKCQGFGSSGSRGSRLEYLEIIKGDLPKDKDNIFEGINTTWTRLKGGEKILPLVEKLKREFDHAAPEKSIPDLLITYGMIKDLEESNWKNLKLKETEAIITACLGIHLEAVSTEYHASPGDWIELEIEATNRSNFPVKLNRMQVIPGGLDTIMHLDLAAFVESKFSVDYYIPNNQSYTNPYWLNDTGSLGMYKVEEQDLRGTPESKRAVGVQFILDFGNTEIDIFRNIVYKTTDPVKGEWYRPFEIVPKLSVKFAHNVQIFASSESKVVEVELRAFSDSISGKLSLEVEDGWKVVPEMHKFNISSAGMEQSFLFEVIPPAEASVSVIHPMALAGGESYQSTITEIQYDHIPVQTVLTKANAKLVKLNIEKSGQRIAYVTGAGDQVPESLEQIGYEVDLLETTDLRPEILKNYDACILGIRAYNTNTELKHKQNELFAYVHNGGRLIVQYNTSRGIDFRDIGPYPLSLSRDRVSNEEAEVRFNLPEHEILQFPNKITSADFDDWVQERGLYFPGEWDEKYDAVFSMNDPDESPKNGSLLVTRYGKGYYIYSGLSWFRQLPAGVPGAYRLFANILSIGNKSNP